MHKSKKTIGALQTYLGRDKEGLQRLDAVTRDMNELRKQGNASALAASAAKTVASQSRTELLQSVEEVQKLKQELAHSQSMARQRERDICVNKQEIGQLQAKIDKLLPEVHVPPDVNISDDVPPAFPLDLLDPRKLVDAFNQLRKEMTICPKPSKPPKASVHRGYMLNDIVSNYSATEMMKLGRFVTCLAMCNFPATIMSQVSFMDGAAPLQVPEQGLANFIYWFRSNLHNENASLMAKIADKYPPVTGLI